MINRSLNKQILLLEITLSGAMLGVFFFFFGEGFFFQLAISAPNYLFFFSFRNYSDVIQDGISYKVCLL